MPLDPALVLALAARCAPAVSPETLLAVARAESGLDPLAIGVNGAAQHPAKPRTSSQAALLGRRLIDAGRDVDLGLAQINVRHLARLGLSVEAAFEPCRNLAAAAQVLAEGYDRAMLTVRPGQAALRVALSYYNTGHPERGIRNGYVARVMAHASTRDPSAAREAAAGSTTPHSAVRLRATRTFVLSPIGDLP